MIQLGVDAPAVIPMSSEGIEFLEIQCVEILFGFDVVGGFAR